MDGKGMDGFWGALISWWSEYVCVEEAINQWAEQASECVNE